MLSGLSNRIEALKATYEMKNLTICCPNGSRVTIAVDERQFLLQILEEACKKKGFLATEHGLRFQGRFLDLSQQVKYFNLPNNCMLEMLKKEVHVSSEVDVAVQLSDGTRKQQKFHPDTTLWSLLEKLDVVAPAAAVSLGSVESLTVPVAQYVNADVLGEVALRHKTLKMLGIISGKVLIRFSMRIVSAADLERANSEVLDFVAQQKRLDEGFEKKLSANVEREAREQEQLNAATAASAQEELQRQEEQFAMDEQQRLYAEADASNAVSAVGRYKAANIPVAMVKPIPQQAASGGSRLDVLSNALDSVNRSIDQNTDFLPMEVLEAVPAVSAMQCEFMDFKFPSETEGKDLRSQWNNSATNADGLDVQPCERQLIVFNINASEEQSSTSGFAEIQEVPSEFFEYTTEDIRLRQKQLREESNQLAAQTLISPAFIAAENRRRKIIAFKFTVVRFHFPDRIVIQAVFRSCEMVSALYECLTSCLSLATTSFDLYLPPSVVPKKDQSLLDAGLSPCANVMIRFRDSSGLSNEVIKPDILAKLTTILAAEAECHDALCENGPFLPFSPQLVSASGSNTQTASSEDSSACERRENRRETSAPNLPKWLQPKKK